MATAERALTWETFALTDTRWLFHAFAGAVALWVAMNWLPWLFVNLVAVMGLAAIAAVAAAPWIAPDPAPDPGTVIRYALVDAVFVAFAAPAIVVPLAAACAAAGWLPLGSEGRYPALPVATFVVSFYGALALVPSLRRRSRWLPGAAAAGIGAFLAAQAWGPWRMHAGQQSERDAGVRAFERATGERTDDLTKLRIGNSAAGFDGRVTSIALDAEGRLVVAGSFEFYAGRRAHEAARLMPDGRLDDAFAAPPAPPNPATDRPACLSAPGVDASQTFACAKGPDGSVFAASHVPMAGSARPAYHARIVRLGPDGRIDSRFAVPDGTFANVDTIAVLADGRLLVAGRRGAGWQGSIVRFGDDGRIDATFGGPEGVGPVEGFVTTIVPQADGRIVVGGEFLAIGPKGSSLRAYNIARLQPDGRPDPGFVPR